MSEKWLLALGVSLGLTLLVETGAALVSGKRGLAIAVTALASLITNPPAVLFALYRRSALWGYEPLWIITTELLVVATEAAIYLGFKRLFPHPLRYSLALNALSFCAGLLLGLII